MHMSIAEAITKLQSKQIAYTTDSLNYSIDGEVIVTIDGHIICSYLVEGHVSFYNQNDEPVGDYRLTDIANVRYFTECEL